MAARPLHGIENGVGSRSKTFVDPLLRRCVVVSGGGLNFVLGE